MVADVVSLADEARPSEVWYFLGYSVLDDEPDIVAGYCCLHFFIGVGCDTDGGRGVDFFWTNVEIEVVFPFDVRLG